MNPTPVLAIIAIAYCPLVIIGMVISDLPYWLYLDVAMIIISPVIGFRLLQHYRKRGAPERAAE